MRSTLFLFAIFAVTLSDVAVPTVLGTESKFELEKVEAGLEARTTLWCGFCVDLVDEAKHHGGILLTTFLNNRINAGCVHAGKKQNDCKKALKTVVRCLVRNINKHVNPENCCRKVKLC